MSATPTAQLGGLFPVNVETGASGGRRRRHRGGLRVTAFSPLGGRRRRHRGGQDMSPNQGAMLRGGNDTESWDIEMGAKEASNDEYNALDAAEKGEAGSNVVGGTRRRRHRRSGRKSRKGGRKTRRHRKRSHRRH